MKYHIESNNTLQMEMLLSCPALGGELSGDATVSQKLVHPPQGDIRDDVLVGRQTSSVFASDHTMRRFDSAYHIQNFKSWPLSLGPGPEKDSENPGEGSIMVILPVGRQPR